GVTGRGVGKTDAARAGKQAALATTFVGKWGGRWSIFNALGDLIIAELTPKGYKETDGAHLLEPTTAARGGRTVVWSHPAFANRCLYVRNDKEIICVSLAGG